VFVGAALAGGALLNMANRNLSSIAFTRVVTLLPVALGLYAGVRPGMKIEQRIIPLALVLSVVGTHLPDYLGCGLAAAAVILFGLATMPDSATAKISKARGMPDFAAALGAVVAMTVVLLTENFLIWVLSATFEPGMNVDTAPLPLQDNGKSIIKHFFSSLSKEEVIGLRRLWNTQWVLVVCLGASFFVVELFDPIRSLYSVGTRAFLTIAVARFTRTVSFMLTVIPSQIEGCYDLRFPNPPPSDWKEWILVGFLPRTKGGCNDLIISGHAVIMTTITCLATSVANDRIFSVALWSMLLLDYSVVVYEGLHYSVDMWLGMILVVLLWRVLKPLERPTNSIASTVNPPRPQSHNSTLTVRNAIWYAPPAIVAYLQMVVLPLWAANFVIFMYILIALTIYFKFVLKETKEVRKQPVVHALHAAHSALCYFYGIGYISLKRLPSISGV